MTHKDFIRAFDELTFSSDFNETAKRRLYAAAQERKEQTGMKHRISKKAKIALIAAALILALGLSAGAAAHFMLPKEAQEFMQMEDLHIADVLANGEFDVQNVTAVKQAVRSQGHTITFEAVVEGTLLKADVFSQLEAMRTGDPTQIQRTPEEATYAVITVKKDGGGPVLGLDPVYELHEKLGASLFIQGIQPLYYHLQANYISIDDTVYMFVPLHDAAIFADRELRIGLYGDFAPTENILTMDKDGLPVYKASYRGIRAIFQVDLDDSLADHAAVAALEEERPFLPTDWERAHGLAD